jgi:hypothetical protein
MAKLAKSKREKTTSKTKVAVREVVERALSNKASDAAVKAAVREPEGQGVDPASKKISQKFLEAMEKRRGGWGARKGAAFGGRPPARRGRRPKASSEYTPENNSEEAYVLESEFERIEHDTGISYKSQGGEDGGFSLDRIDDFDEELNFDR